MRGNTALAYYISNEQISKDFSSILLNNYFKVWKIDAMNSHHFTSNDLTNYQDQLTRGITFKEWAQVKNNVKQYMKTNLSIGQPMGVEKFKPATNAITMVQIYHVKDESGTDKYGLIIQTICSIRNRMVVIDHHLIYEGEETIAYGKRETRSFIEKLNERNG